MTLHLLFSISDLLSLLFRLIGYLMYSWSGQVSFHIFPYFAFHLWVKIWFFLWGTRKGPGREKERAKGGFFWMMSVFNALFDL